MPRAVCLVSLGVMMWSCATLLADDLQPGLVGEYYALKSRPTTKDEAPAGQQPFFVRVDNEINFTEAAQEFHGTKLVDQFFARWQGVLRVAKPGKYTFTLESNDGSRLYINGKQIINHWSIHKMLPKKATIDLEAGDHNLLVTFCEVNTEAGCILRWTPPEGEEAVVPASALFHRPQQAELAWDEPAWAKSKLIVFKKPKPGVAFDKKRFGPFIGTAVSLGNDAKGNNIVYRGFIIPLDDAAESCVVFDADTMRLAGGWTDDGLILDGLPFTGGHGTFPKHEGDPTFRLQAMPGWAKGDSLADPREGQYPPLGSLPKDWAHYTGLFVNGDHVTLSYTVGKSKVLETPSLIANDKGPIIVRSLEIERDGTPLTLALCDVLPTTTTIEGNVAVAGYSGRDVATVVGIGGMPTDGKLVVKDNVLTLTLPAAEGKSAFDIRYWRGPILSAEGMTAAVTEKSAVDFAALTKPGPAKWTEEIVTKGDISKDDKAAYVLDRITVPYQNPYGADMEIGGFDFFKDGTTAACSTWDGEIWIVKGIDDDLDKLEWKRFATGLHEPLGLKIVDDVIYTVADDQITRFHDTNNDGEADYYENFNNDWDLTSGFHAFCFDLHNDPEGNFMFSFGSPVRPGGGSFERMSRHHGKVLKVSKDGSKLDIYASGLRAPNGMCVSPTGQVTTGDNEGTFVPRCPIHWVSPGEFLGVVDSAEHYADMKTTPTVDERRGGRPQNLDASEMPKPLAWLPKNVDNSGGGQAWVTSDRWGPLAGEMLHMSYGQSSLYLVLKEQKGDLMQGGVTKFPLRFTSSAMRARFNPRDGQLYVGGLRGWQTNAGTNGGLDRVRYTGKPVQMPKALRAKKNGIEIEFLEKLEPEVAADPDSFAIKASDIRWTHGYGSGEYEIGQRDTDPNKWKQGWTEFEVTDAKLLDDGKTVLLTIDGLQPVHQMQIQYDLEAADGTPLTGEIWNTIHVAE